MIANEVSYGLPLVTRNSEKSSLGVYFSNLTQLRTILNNSQCECEMKIGDA